MIRYFHSEDPNQKYKNDETLKDLENKQLPGNSINITLSVYTIVGQLPELRGSV